MNFHIGSLLSLEKPLRATFKLLISILKLQGRVLLPGSKEQVIEELRKSKIFYFSSNYEGLSNSMIEALCVGLAIITTKVSGTEDFIKENKNGFLLEKKNVDGMKKAIRKLISDESLRKIIGDNNRQQAKIFKIENIFHQWENIINKEVNQK